LSLIRMIVIRNVRKWHRECRVQHDCTVDAMVGMAHDDRMVVTDEHRVIFREKAEIVEDENPICSGLDVA
jgi:hypothetical protein